MTDFLRVTSKVKLIGVLPFLNRTYARKTHNLLILFKNIKIGQFKQLVVFKWFFIEICVSPIKMRVARPTTRHTMPLNI